MIIRKIKIAKLMLNSEVIVNVSKMQVKESKFQRALKVERTKWKKWGLSKVKMRLMKSD